MATLNFLIEAALDPVQAALVLAILLAYRGPQPIAVAGTAAALASQAVMALVVGLGWAELLAPRLVASLAQAAVLCWAVRLLRGRVHAGLRRLAGGTAATLTSIAAGSALPRPAPWPARGPGLPGPGIPPRLRRPLDWLRHRLNAAKGCESE